MSVSLNFSEEFVDPSGRPPPSPLAPLAEDGQEGDEGLRTSTSTLPLHHPPLVTISAEQHSALLAALQDGCRTYLRGVTNS